MSICVFGDRTEVMPAYFGGFAERRGVDVLWLSESELGDGWAFEYSDLARADGQLRCGKRRVEFGEITGAYVNLNSQPRFPSELNAADEECETFLVLRRASIRNLINALPGIVANRPYAGRSNNSKPYQMRLLERAGFRVPDWIASNNFDAVQEFAEAHTHDVVVKSCSGLRSEVRAFDATMAERLHEGTTPIIAQKRIPGFDVRVHTVDGHTFGTAMEGEGIDYRFSQKPTSYRTIEPPADIVARCHAFASEENMVIAGFDFRTTASGEWWCLEMNPVPTFLPYEVETGQPICETLLHAMVRRRVT